MNWKKAGLKALAIISPIPIEFLARSLLSENKPLSKEDAKIEQNFHLSLLAQSALVV